MAEGCPHVKQLQLASDKSFLNPRSWACGVCGFTDSVWACLLCSNVACGRTNSRHALRHFEQTKHPIAVDVNNRYVHCYLCNDYVLADNCSDDISLVQSLLVQVASQTYSESCSRSGRIIRPAQSCFTRSRSRVEAAIDHAADKRYTALCHWRYSQLASAFNAWRAHVNAVRATDELLTQQKQVGRKRKKLLIPGMTGLRNLGNTCYMNAVLQSLSHLVLFRECFRQLLPEFPPSKPGHIAFTRQTTIECFQHITTRPAGLVRRCGRLARQNGGGGLSGGEGGRPVGQFFNDEENLSLSVEMHALMRVMWSGKWAVVTPHAVLNAVWKLIPSFHGYTQQDAQELLCELLLVMQTELEQWPGILLYPSSLSQPFLPHLLLPSLFQGQLLSKLIYSGCGHCSTVQEPFWDLSLDFPEDALSCQLSSIPLEDLLRRFTSLEVLEGEQYCCDTCRHSNHQSAHKKLMIAKCPKVLRLHLKRFHWSGRTRQKIKTHVCFPIHLDLQPFCTRPNVEGSSAVVMTTTCQDYQLSSVIMHHGLGFQSGHYTTYSWNSEAESWVHCNDARLTRCTDNEVLNCQAYILFYTCKNGVEGEILEPSYIEGEILGIDEPSPKRKRIPK